AYLDQPGPGHASLRDAIAARLAPFAWPPDMNALKTALAEIRRWIEDQADFTPAQRAAVLAALQDAGFTPDRKIRFRSSTNVEDTEQFSGAGLYDSFSGCLADDLDGDNQGPSRCDPAEPRERGVFRALRKVYASFYNDNAYLERLRRGVDEAVVGMALLVHHSTPDEIELANGVATITVNRQWGARHLGGDLVTQAGAVSVTNPDTTARPERVRGSASSPADLWLDLVDRSALVPLGGHVLAWPAEYRQLWALLDAAARAYEAEFPAKPELLLDFEYKKVAPAGRLSVKQIREVPRPDAAPVTPAWLLGDTNRYVVFQGERGELLANHRLKARLALATRSLKLSGADLTNSPFTGIGGELLAGSSPTHLAGTPPAALPAYSFHRFADATEDRWRLGTGADERRYALRVNFPQQAGLHGSPLTSLGEMPVELSVTYATRQPALGWEPRFTNTPGESVLLVPARRVTAESLRQEREVSAKGVTDRSSF
ncbi:MAG TPA: PEP/pyruvate-binding domain-containing protein, partial [Verrucomicrobiota bacterium]|nr:PEP/pyruvate-binding domain-containing protein [Verrucomicrobiota bacterium]